MLKRSELGTRETADLGAETMGAETVGAQIVGATIMDLAGAIPMIGGQAVCGRRIRAIKTFEGKRRSRTTSAVAQEAPFLTHSVALALGTPKTDDAAVRLRATERRLVSEEGETWLRTMNRSFGTSSPRGRDWMLRNWFKGNFPRNAPSGPSEHLT